MNQSAIGPIVAGVDFSPASDTAVSYAAWEAQSQHRTLALLHGYNGLASGVPPITGYEVSMTHDAEDRLAAIAARVREEHPGLDVTSRVWRGPGVHGLIDVSTDAAMLVVASRGHGGFRQLLIGSVAAQVVAHASCPVVVVRPGEEGKTPGAGPVLVGVDGSGYSRAAIDLAFAEASRRSTSLVAVSVWVSPDLSGLSESRTGDDEVEHWQSRMKDDADRIISEALSGVRDRYPDVEVIREAVRGISASHELMEASDRVSAALTVVGSRGQGGFAGLMLGSVSQELLTHGLGTLAVARSEQPPIG